MAYELISFGLSFLPALAYVAAGIFAITQWSRYPKPSRLMLIAVSLMVVTSVTSFTLRIVLARSLSPQDFGSFMLAFSAVSTLLHLLSFGVLVSAVYSGRTGSADSNQPNDRMPPDAQTDHSNPYVPPR
jgi:O-antigen/teichoic acid export membrane protein